MQLHVHGGAGDTPDDPAARERGLRQAVAVGPTPQSALVVAGEVEGVDETNGSVVLDVAIVEAPVEPPEE